ncbi:MAG: hypothetical protein HQL64_09275 [Magnetococcales bacterium]|nr:hypothetical protein [Magnetococcales bacterium]
MITIEKNLAVSGKVLLLGVATMLAAPPAAQAGLFDKIEHGVSKAANTVGNTATNAANTVGNTATSTANTVGNAVTNAANTVANVSKDEAKALATTAKSTYSSAASTVQSGYNASVNFVKSSLTAALEALFRATAGKFLSANKTILTNLQTGLRNLDDEGKAALNRIKRAIPTGQITAQAATDMKLLAAKLKLAAGTAGSNIPSNVVNSSWGIPLGGASVGLIAGVDGEVALIMNVQPTNGKYTYAIMSYTGGSLGATVESEATVPGSGIVWQPGTIADNEGWSVGLGIAGALGAGGGLGLSWGVAKGMSGAANAIPGIELSTDGGAKVDVSFKAGYTKILKTGTM